MLMDMFRETQRPRAQLATAQDDSTERSTPFNYSVGRLRPRRAVPMDTDRLRCWRWACVSQSVSSTGGWLHLRSKQRKHAGAAREAMVGQSL
eukprot:COSAG02_NODE_16336_length_1091_cov_36.183193_1_plen_92_part_00